MIDEAGLSTAGTFIALGALFLGGLAADTLGRRTRVPRVTLLLLLGVIAGPSMLGAIPQQAVDWYGPLSTLALTMVAFLLGSALTRETLAARGRAIVAVSAAVVVVTATAVTGGLWLLGVDPVLAVLFGAIATATAPAATQATLDDAGARGPFAETVRGVVAVDDALGMIAFALALVAAQALAGGGWDPAALGHAARDLGGAVALGLALGLPAAALTGRVRAGEPTRLEALGLVFLAAGLALWLGVSFLVTGMVAGATIANLARHHDRAFHEIERIEAPFLMLFFLLAGAALELSALAAVGGLGAAYAALRIAGRVGGGWVGGWLGGLRGAERVWVGPALLAQAGVAVGMALVAARAFPDRADAILTVTIGMTVLFELIGPLALTVALRRAGAVGDGAR